MNELQLEQLLKSLVADVEKRVGCKVACTPNKNKPREFRLEVLNPPASRSCKKNVFGFAGIRPRVGCLGVSTWVKCLADANVSKMPNAQRKKRMHWDEDGVKWDICQPNSMIYDEVVYALSVACKYCLK